MPGSFLNVKARVVVTFSVIVKIQTSQRFVSSSSGNKSRNVKVCSGICKNIQVIGTTFSWMFSDIPGSLFPLGAWKPMRIEKLLLGSFEKDIVRVAFFFDMIFSVFFSP